MTRSINFYIYQTGMGINLLIMTVFTFIVGLSISGQTFYTFILENLERFGALKAIGTTSRELTLMILFQATFTALTGYGLGIGLCTLAIAIAKAEACRLRGHDHLHKSCSGSGHGHHHRRRLQLCRNSPGSADRALRHLPRMICRV